MRKPRYSSDMTEADYQAACDFARDLGFVSIGRIQRHLGVGFNAAARVVEWMEERGFCTRADFQGRRTLIQ